MLGTQDGTAAPFWGRSPWGRHGARKEGHHHEECTAAHYMKQLCVLPQDHISSEAGQGSREEQTYAGGWATQLSEATVTHCVPSPFLPGAMLASSQSPDIQ